MKKSSSIIFLVVFPLSATSAFCPLSTRQQLQQGPTTTTHRDSFCSRDPRLSSAAVSNQESSTSHVLATSTSSQLEAATTACEEQTTTTTQQQQPVDNDADSVVVMSQALPFLPCPPVLRDNNFAGNVGFDPLGLAQTTEQLWHYREAEIKHARLAMLAAAGWPISELCDRQLAAWFGFEPLLDSHDRAPSLFDNWKGLAAVPPAFWGFLFGLTAVIELEYGMHSLFSKKQIAQHNLAKQQDIDYFPGKLGLDPLGFYPHSVKGRRRMQLAEIKHGRLAMIAVVFYCLAEFILKEGIIDEVESFLQMPTFPSFFPMLSPTAETLETEFFVERLVAME